MAYRHGIELSSSRIREVTDALRLKKVWRRAVPSPAPNMDYYLPEAGFIDFSTWGVLTFLILADKPCRAALEFSEDGVTFKEIAGYSIEPADWDTNRYNNMLTDIGMYYGRLKVSTGPVAPSSITILAVGRP